MKRLIYLTIITLSLAVAAPGNAAEKKSGRLLGIAAPDSSDNVKTDVVSDTMITDSEHNMVRFIGNVVAHHGKMTVKAEELEIYSDEKQETMKHIFATGSVVITTETREMKSDRAEFYKADKKLVLIGNASITKGENKVTGEKIIYFYDKEDIIVGGGATERATFKVIPSKESQDKGKKDEKAGVPRK